MTKHVRTSRRRQAVERPPAATVRIPLPVLGAFARIERSYFELCIRAGQQVLDAMMEQDRTALCGPRWKRDPDRQAGRAGTTPSEGTLGGRRIQLTRPRVRSQSEQEVELPGFAFASHRDPLAHHATRGSSLPDRADRWDRPGRPLGRGRARHRCRGQEAGAGAAGRPHRTQPRRQGTAARPRRARVGSGTRARLFVVDGAKALTSVIHTVFGTLGAIQRCQLHKWRNILGHRLPGAGVPGPGLVDQRALRLFGAVRAHLQRLTFDHRFVHYPLLRRVSTAYSPRAPRPNPCSVSRRLAF